MFTGFSLPFWYLQTLLIQMFGLFRSCFTLVLLYNVRVLIVTTCLLIFFIQNYQIGKCQLFFFVCLFLTLHHFSQSGKYMYICVGCIDVASFYDSSIGLQNCSDRIVFVRLSFLCALQCYLNRNGDLMVSVLASIAVDREFKSQSVQTKDYKIGICCFSAKHSAFRRKSKVWLARTEYNVREWDDMSVRGLLFQ